MNLRGIVQLQVVVRADGTVKEVHVVGGHPMLAAAAEQAVMKWRYQPAAKETIETVKIAFGQ
jgi:TonB family protein